MHRIDRDGAAALIEPLTELVARAGAAILAVNRGTMAVDAKNGSAGPRDEVRQRLDQRNCAVGADHWSGCLTHGWFSRRWSFQGLRARPVLAAQAPAVYQALKHA